MSHLCKQNKNYIINLIGPPGSGKSTQLSLLYSLLDTIGVKVKVIKFKRGFFSSLFEKVIFTIIYGDRNNYPYLIELLLRGADYKIKGLFHLWYKINTIEVYARTLWYKMLNSIGYNLLIEDYIPAIIADYIYVSLMLNLHLRVTIKKLIPLFRLYTKTNPIILIHLYANIEILQERWEKRGRGEKSKKYLSVQKILSYIAKILSHSIDRYLSIDTAYSDEISTLKKILSDGLRCTEQK